MSYVKSLNGYLIKDEEARNSITEEVINRTNAINAEATARTEAINVEATARTEAINAEATARTEAINAEASARSVADNNTLLSSNSKLSRSGRKIIMIGDSYGIQNDGSVSTFYWEYFRDELGLTQNVNFYSSFQSGAGFGNGNFLAQLEILSNSIVDKNSITDIFISGGWNDSDKSQSYGTDEMFNNGVTNFNTYVNTNYPNAQITLAHISWGDPEIVPALREQMPISVMRYNEQSAKGWRVLSGTEWILHRYDGGLWQNDGAHPNQFGQGLLGMYLPSAFLTGSVNIIYKGEAKAIESANNNFILSSNSNSIIEEFNNGIYSWCFTANNFYLTTINENIIDCTGHTFYPAFKANTIFGKAEPEFNIQTVTALLYGGNKWYLSTMQVKLHNKTVYIAPRVIDDNGSIDDLTILYIFIPPLSFMMSGLNS